MKNEIIAGLDLGTSKVTCMIAKISPVLYENGTNPGPEIIGVGISESKGLSNGIVINLERATESIKTAISTAEKNAGVKLTELYTAITGAHIRGESSRGVTSISRSDKEITPADVSHVIDQAQAIKVPMDRSIIHSIPQEFILDDQPGIHDPIGMNANRLEGNIYIITGATTAVQNITKSVNRAGFKVRDIVLQPIASSYAVLDPDEQELGCVLIDMGGGTTDVAVFYNGGIHDILSLPLGGADITNDISIGLSTPRRIAEQIKLKHGVARSDLAHELPPRPRTTNTNPELIKIQKLGHNSEQVIEKKLLASIIAPRIEEIFALLRQKLTNNGRLPTNDRGLFYYDFLPSGIILTGGTAKMPGITGLAERVFGIPAKIGVPNTIDVNQYKDPSFATSVGLIIYGSLNNQLPTMNRRSQTISMGKFSKTPLITTVSNRVRKWLLE